MSRRIAFCADGAWDGAANSTNVYRISKAIVPMPGEQYSFYDDGVGADGTPIEKLLGGAIGEGLLQKVRDGYSTISSVYEDGDEIFIFGFSRGAYTARSLAGFIAKCGLLKAGSPLGVRQLYNRYRRTDAKTIWALIDAQEHGTLGDPTIEEKWMLKYSMAVHIKLVGVWDTVGALGIPIFSIQGITARHLDFSVRGCGARSTMDFTPWRSTNIDERFRPRFGA